jgi:hypothetical protein
VAACRFSLRDPRPRHQGVSHHFTTALTVATRCRSSIAVPAGPFEGRVRADLAAAGVTDRHEVITVADAGVAELLAGHGLVVTTMGRTPADDPGAFAVAGAAGTLAAGLLAEGP